LDNIKKITNMRKVFTFILILFTASFAKAQDPVVVLEVGKIPTALTENIQLALTGGIINYNDDIVAIGLVGQKFGDDKTRIGGRLNVDLSLNKFVAFYTQSDVYPQKNKPRDARFLEIGAGLAFKFFKYGQISAGYQMNSYDPVRDINLEDQLLTRISFHIPLANNR